MTPDKLRKLLDKYEGDWEVPDLVDRHDWLMEYLELREKGNGHKFALMLVVQKAPGAKTEREFFAGRHTLADQFRGNEQQLQAVVSTAQACGYRPQVNDVYEPALAEFPGDPRAFINPSGGLTQVRQQCEARGLTCDGDVKVKGRPPERPIEAGPLAQDIVNDLIRERAAKDPDLLRRVNRRDLEDDIRAKHGFTDAKRSGESSAVVGDSLETVVRTAKPKPRPKSLPTKMKWRKKK